MVVQTRSKAEKLTYTHTQCTFMNSKNVVSYFLCFSVVNILYLVKEDSEKSIFDFPHNNPTKRCYAAMKKTTDCICICNIYFIALQMASGFKLNYIPPKHIFE